MKSGVAAFNRRGPSTLSVIPPPGPTDRFVLGDPPETEEAEGIDGTRACAWILKDAGERMDVVWWAEPTVAPTSMGEK